MAEDDFRAMRLHILQAMTDAHERAQDVCDRSRALVRESQQRRHEGLTVYIVLTPS